MRPKSVTQTGVGASAWIYLDHQQANFNVGYGADITGAPTYDIEVAYQDPQAGGALTAYKLETGKTAVFHGKVDRPVSAIRVNITAVSTSGSVRLDVLQGDPR